jgi:radical SAM protein with 4Fe4S-binding SPASM domain
MKIGEILRRLTGVRRDVTSEPAVLNPDYSCSMPTSYCVEPTNVCNLRCPFCPTGTGAHETEKGIMSFRDYLVILNKISPYAKNINFSLRGEPFLNKNLTRMISLASYLGVQTTVASNFALKGIDHERLAHSGLEELIVGMESEKKEIYERCRVGGDVAVVLDNIRRLQKAKERAGTKKPRIMWRFLINKFNEDGQEDARQLASDLGIGIEFYLMYVPDPAWKSTLHDVRRDMEPFQVGNTDAYEKSPRALPVPLEQIRLHPYVHGNCTWLFNSLLIRWDGSVVPCCVGSYKRLSLGNILDGSLRELWNNARFKSCREFVFNYGPKQRTRSICETVDCLVKQKHAGSAT